ncbi:MAG: roadblock/LC7 domain-containing protein [Candidatus Thorarchaeota archaeon]
MHHQNIADIPLLIRELLKDLCNRSPILGAAILPVEGLPFVSYFQTNIDDAAVAVLVASAQAAGEQTVKELRQGSLKSILVEGTAGFTLILSIAEDYLLVVTAPDNAKIGLVLNDARRAGREAARLLQELS